jgi:hypothetical protein
MTRSSRSTEVVTLVVVAFLLAMIIGVLILTSTDLYERYRKQQDVKGTSGSVPVSSRASRDKSRGPVPARKTGQGRSKGGRPTQVRRPTGSPVRKPW